MALLAAFVSLIFLYSLVAGRLERTVVTAPILFTIAGMVVVPLAPGVRDRALDMDVFLRAAEIGLVMLLFTDASRTDLRVLRDIRALPIRLLGIGMPLTILFGAVAARLVFPELSLWEVGALSAILAPTDAGLGQVIVNSPRVPERIRQALNVEAGLNDGLSVPFLLFFVALAGPHMPGHGTTFAQFVLEQLVYGAAIGLAIGGLGGWLLGAAVRRNWASAALQPLAVVALPLLCILASDAFDASMFIAAFVAGLAVQVGFKQAGKHAVEFADGWGQMLNLSVFFLFGVLVARERHFFSAPLAVYAVISLTAVRMIPVAIALLGTRLGLPTVLFMGWFGPRGLASIVLGLVFLERVGHTSGESTVALAVMATVAISIFAHGFSALPGINLYAARLPRDAQA